MILFFGLKNMRLSHKIMYGISPNDLCRKKVTKKNQSTLTVCRIQRFLSVFFVFGNVCMRCNYRYGFGQMGPHNQPIVNQNTIKNRKV